jgi:hypothetical protein
MIKGALKHSDFNPNKARDMLIYLPHEQFDFVASKLPVYISPSGELHIDRSIEESL